MLILSVGISTLLLSIAWAVAAPSGSASSSGHQGSEKCGTLKLRKEWRDLTIEERVDYIRAVGCLRTIPSTSGRQGVKTLFDEFQKTHIDLTDDIHQVGQFLPWHRRFLIIYADALLEQCGYQGPATYWDWTRDAESPKPILDSPIFDPVSGFGGDGVAGTYKPPPRPPFLNFDDFLRGPPPGLLTATATSTSFIDPPTQSPTTTRPFGGFPTTGFPGFPGSPTLGCVGTGPFNTTTVNLGPGTGFGEHCLVRGINEEMRSSVSAANVEVVLAQTEFEVFRNLLENGGPGITGRGVHIGGHSLVGGEMADPFSSPGDPLFYLHHGNLDRIWWKWQNADPSNRLYAISGLTTWRPPFANLTLDFEMTFYPLQPVVPVREVMDIESEPNCYTYAD